MVECLYWLLTMHESYMYPQWLKTSANSSQVRGFDWFKPPVRHDKRLIDVDQKKKQKKKKNKKKQ